MCDVPRNRHKLTVSFEMICRPSLDKTAEGDCFSRAANVVMCYSYRRCSTINPVTYLAALLTLDGLPDTAMQSTDRCVTEARLSCLKVLQHFPIQVSKYQSICTTNMDVYD
jgi:hypothetical protein